VGWRVGWWVGGPLSRAIGLCYDWRPIKLDGSFLRPHLLRLEFLSNFSLTCVINGNYTGHRRTHSETSLWKMSRSYLPLCFPFSSSSLFSFPPFNLRSTYVVLLLSRWREGTGASRSL